MIKDIINFLDKEKGSFEELKENIRLENFQEISSKDSGTLIFAVDGGSTTIVDGGNWNLAKIKVSYVAYKNSQRVKEKTNEFFFGSIKKGKSVIIKIIPEVKELNFIPKDTPLEELPNLARSTLEWLKIKELIDASSEKTLILRDGAFNSIEPFEINLIKKTIETASDKGINIIGVCKTSRSSLPSGRSLLGGVNEFGSKNMPDKKWIYSSEDWTVAKLHERSSFCYKIESNIKDMEELKKSLGFVSFYSKDPELIGYPYPLLKVDKIARVREFERDIETRKTKMLAKKLKCNFIEFDEMSTNMHNLLDKRAYR